MTPLRTLIIGLVSLIIGINPLFSEYINPYDGTNKMLYQKKNTAYSIYIPGKKTSSGWTPAKIINIPRVPKEDYMPGVIHIKTKSRIEYDKNANLLYSSALMSDLNSLNIKNIRSPFAFTGDNMLEVDKIGTDRILEIYYSSPVDPYDACIALLNNPEVEYAVPVFIYKAFDYTPNDPRLSNQWYVSNIQLPKAWDLSKGSTDVVIGIVDSGTDWLHEDLAANIWTNPGEIPNNGIDDDKNGKIDDVRGWDLVGNVNQNQIAIGQYAEDNDPRNTGSGSTNTHGTHVAGCASAVADNGKGIAGPGFKCKLMPVKCATDQNGITGIFRGYEGITYAANNGAKIINCSWGGPGYSPVGQDVIDAALAKGALVVVAAGNEGMNIDNGEFYPACYDHVLNIGSSTSNNTPSYFSNTGVAVSVYSPGSSILSTMPNNTYQNSDGTSMASPVAAGVAALVCSMHPEFTPLQVLHQIRSTSDNVVTNNASLRPYYYGRINAFKALDYNRNGGPNIPGLEITNIFLTSGDALVDYEPIVVRLEVTNFLASAGNVIMKIQPLNNFIAINTADINIGNLAQGQKKNVDLSLQLLKTNPWYEGTANIIITFTSATYTDYQLLKIPVKIPTKNIYSTLGTLPEYYVPAWTGAVATKENVLWLSGYGGMFGNNGGFYRIVGSQPSGKPISGEYFFCIDARDENKAYAGSATTTGSSATIQRTINGGSNWTPSVVTNITTFINSIKFYDDNNGVFIGDQKGGKWGIGLSSDGGATWTQPVTMPAPQANENGLVGCAAYLNSNIWFGTNQGRVIRSNDQGKSWDATQISGAAQIYQVAILNDNNGLAVYNETGKTDKLIASTTNGGTTWQTNKYNLTTNRLNPIYFYTNVNAGRIYMLCSGGQVYSTKSNGQVWDAVLSKFHSTATVGAACDVPISKMRMWDIGESFGYLDFAYTPANIVKTLQLTTSSTVIYDTVRINSFKLQSVTIKNTGNVPITIFPVITPDAGTQQDEFKLFGFSNGEIQPGTELTLRVRFSPLGLGLRTAVLNVTSDATPSDIRVELSGIGSEAVSVEESANNDKIFITPNPTHDFIEIISYNSLAAENISVFNALGEPAIKNISATINQNDGANNAYRIDVSMLPAGIYFIRINNDIRKFIKL